MTTKVKKPSDVVLELYNLGFISSIKVDYRQTGVDTGETFCELVGDNGRVCGLWDIYEDFLVVTVDYNSVASLNRIYENEVEKWKEYEEANKKDLKEYERLKKKFGINDNRF